MSDALDRIRQRTKPKVPPRDSSLTSPAPQSLDVQTSRHIDVSNSEVREKDLRLDTQPSSHTGVSSHQGRKNESIIDIQTSRYADISTPETYGESPIYPSALNSRHTDIQTSKLLEDSLLTKRSTFRLESNLIERLHTFCRRQGLSREVLIEAMYEYMEAHPEAMDQVVIQAKAKNDYRQQIANRKRAESMMSKFGGGQAGLDDPASRR